MRGPGPPGHGRNSGRALRDVPGTRMSPEENGMCPDVSENRCAKRPRAFSADDAEGLLEPPLQLPQMSHRCEGVSVRESERERERDYRSGDCSSFGCVEEEYRSPRPPPPPQLRCQVKASPPSSPCPRLVPPFESPTADPKVLRGPTANNAGGHGGGATS